MPTPAWRSEKAESTVTAICKVLETELNEEQRSDLSRAVHDALKLLCDSIRSEDPGRGDIWTPGLVELFVSQPHLCDRWLTLLNEPDFNPDYYQR